MEILGDTEDSAFMLNNGAMNPYLILYEGQWYRLFTATFMHFGIQHLANNMLLLFLLGQIFERAVGPVRYLGIYLGSGLAGSFLSFFYLCLMNKNDIVAGASGAIFGIVGGMIIVVLCNRGSYSGISAKRMLFMAALTLYFGFATAGTDNVGHLGGLLAGIILTFISYGIGNLIQNRKKSILLSNKQDEEGQ
ncbi:MAG: rhomboid family intramembrane serine protease [Pseudobutyrivibrio sp.]|nr:rhomboid family intramembrane serine protease [Pseudobutyrivibrio sp.]MBP3261847.1 rhomboid family intramembrane serine protease [Pseudobutyrivibrio sp.]